MESSFFSKQKIFAFKCRFETEPNAFDDEPFYISTSCFIFYVEIAILQFCIYFLYLTKLNPFSFQKHDIPISAIPCLQYQRAIKREERQSLAEDLPCENNSLPEASQPAKTVEALPPPANPENDNTVDVKPDVEAMEMSAVTGQTEIKEENGEDGTDDPSGAGQAVRIESVEDSKKLNNLSESHYPANIINQWWLTVGPVL